MDRSPPGSSVHGILQARTLEWVLPDAGIKARSPALQAYLYQLSRQGSPEARPRGVGFLSVRVQDSSFLPKPCLLSQSTGSQELDTTERLNHRHHHSWPTLWWFQVRSKVIQFCTHTYPFPNSCPIQVITEYWARILKVENPTILNWLGCLICTLDVTMK